ncbi:hypothetical protein I7I50_07804 [Histoplasma capsulatum G186AR]|uniref:Uncharacterized protein n=1 Tax=Ajellomyces capsulatus TaxID=5037 RepID=A0A8H7Z0L3_AJECA|nr:hypothetical protein I7I52_09123 [Histoplasma capsulatum]QSS68402.1 hypothetical protein I7I50_07804 [Histoplasma capsulatum G186AR]
MRRINHKMADAISPESWQTIQEPPHIPLALARGRMERRHPLRRAYSLNESTKIFPTKSFGRIRLGIFFSLLYFS